MYYPIIRQCIQALKNLETWLDKAEQHAAAKGFLITHYPQPSSIWYKTGTYGGFCGFERWRATRCNFKRGSARPSLRFFTEQRISAGRR